MWPRMGKAQPALPKQVTLFRFDLKKGARSALHRPGSSKSKESIVYVHVQSRSHPIIAPLPSKIVPAAIGREFSLEIH